ncbi:MAG: PIG-L deacetylase family protein [Anaerolineales bacterium]
MDALKLMAVFAHPDDESLGIGSTLAKYATEGVETYLVTATRGERGWFGLAEENPGLEALGRTRQAELQAAARVLGLREVTLLDYIDGDLDQADPAQAIANIVKHLRRVRPQVVVTFGPEGAYGHPDHIAISQFTAAAVVCAADERYPAGDTLPHRVAKLYYYVDSESIVALTESVIGEFTMDVDGVRRHHYGWPEWAITTRVDTSAHWRTALEAIYCHKTQVASYELDKLTEEQHQRFWGMGTFYRAYSLVNGGRMVERDLFEGLR